MSFPTTPTIGDKATIDGKQWEYKGDGVWERTDISLRPDIITFDTTNTLTIGDTHIGAYVRIDYATDVTVTLPLHSTDPLPVGSIVTMIQGGAGQVIMAAASGVTLNAYGVEAGQLPATAGQFAGLQIIKVGENEWDVIGHIEIDE